MQSPAEQLDTTFEHAWPVAKWSDFCVLVGVSGGSDSVALLQLLHRAKKRADALQATKGNLVVAHFDHQIRPDSANDADWVGQLATEFKLPIERGHAVAPITSEQEARDARYAFFEAAAARVGARYLATGHTADDQAETILHHVLRGTGLSGLAGMPRIRPLNRSLTLVRPLLRLERASLRSYLAKIGQAYRDDPSNEECIYTRNRIRHELLPHLEQQYNPDVRSALLRLGELAKETQAEVLFIVDQLVAEVVTFATDGSVSIDLKKLKTSQPSPHLARQAGVRIWQNQGWAQSDMSFERWNALAEFLLSDAALPPFELPGKIRVESLGNTALLSPFKPRQ